jgi:hypothetical protein
MDISERSFEEAIESVLLRYPRMPSLGTVCLGSKRRPMARALLAAFRGAGRRTTIRSFQP